jgi:hypothetical protein
MANEIALGINLKVDNGSFHESIQTGTVYANQAVAGWTSGTLAVTSTVEYVVSTGDLTTPGQLYLRNLDATHDVVYGPTSSGAMVPMGRLKSGGLPATLYLEDDVSLRMLAEGGTVNVDCRMFEV